MRETTQVQTRAITGDATGVARIPANPNRKSIIVGGAAGRTTMVQLGAAGDAITGIPLQDSNQYLLLTDKDVGSAVTEEIRLIDTAGVSQTYGYIETAYAL